MPEEKVKTVEEMREFLKEHERYNILNSWNRLTSFSRNVKLYRLQDVPESAYEFLCMDESFDGVNTIIENFHEEHPDYCIAFSGRFDGYLVLCREFSRQSIGDDLDSLKDEEVPELYQLVMDFDKVCQECVDDFLKFCRTHDAVEETIYVEKKVMVAKTKENVQ